MDDKSFMQAVAAIRDDRTSGAGALARQCLALLSKSGEKAPAKSASELQNILDSRAAKLVAARPSMAPVGNLVAQWTASVDRFDASSGSGLDRLRTVATETANRIRTESEATTVRVSELVCDYMHKFLESGQKDREPDRKPTVLTLSWSGVVAEALAGLHGLDVDIVVAESRPLNEGADLARYLADRGLSVTLITDAQLALFADRVDMALCGADTLYADGAILNKVGTRLMALAMADADRPVVVACESFKLALADKREPEIDAPPLEEMPGDELGYGPSPSFDIRNIYFEETPARLITCWCTENGVTHDPAGLAAIAIPYV